MPPDLNSLSPSSSSPRSMSMHSHHGDSNSSPRPSTHSLAAAATMNATERRSSTSRGSPRLDRTTSERRRSQVAMNLNLNDPTIPGPGELPSSDRRSSIGHMYSTASPSSMGGRSILATGDPNHHRQPSLGDIHNELEQEQEAQVNRMLSMIRTQQQQLDTIRAQQASNLAPTQSGTSTAVEDSTPQSERSFSFPSVHPAVGAIPRPTGRLSRENSNPNRSPALRPLPSQDLHNSEPWASSPTDSIRRSSTSRRNSLRDENAYYQAESANLQRENQMLRMRVRELEKQLQEKQHNTPGTPAMHSNLVTSPPLDARVKD
ncbi:hypothetical protein LTS08_004368 [Lithohypha guttulata]|uniref:Uncharacterized protein n=1 Tax=Lithohypha guttulata TaxID=1690604 RepID=A0AAN7T1D7_9EURO|nr:hypothetical protein LTR05_003490 [Lithohypha guttulata]KAK5101909.1 hypothetical protein LTS08_004368 [Lithohypha guttulata]